MPFDGEHTDRSTGFSARQLPVLLVVGSIILALVIAFFGHAPADREISARGTYQTGRELSNGNWSFRIPDDGKSAVTVYSAGSGTYDSLSPGESGYAEVELAEGDIVSVEGTATGQLRLL